MPRPRGFRRILFSPKVTYYKPQGIPMRQLETIELTHEELEALRLKNVEKLDQTQAAQEMQTSQSTFQRILTSAHEKVSEALIKGMAIKIDRKD